MSSLPDHPQPRPLDSTDLWDSAHDRLAIVPPSAFVISIGLSGILAFVATGFLGYAYPGSSPIEWVFLHPWPMFAWLCVLLFALEVALFRAQSMERYRFATLGISLGAVAIVTGLYMRRDQLPALLHGILSWLAHIAPAQGIVLGIINFGTMAVFWILSVRRWMLRSQGYPIAPMIEVAPDEKLLRAKFLPQVAELIAGDLIVAGVLAMVLAWTFHPEGLIHALAALVPAKSLPSSIPDPKCFGLSCTAADTYQYYLYYPLGLVVVGITAVDNALHEVARLRADNPGVPIARTLLESLLAAVARKGIALSQSLLLTARTVLWPCLIILAVGSAGIAALLIQSNLQQGSCAYHVEAGCLHSLQVQDFFLGTNPPFPRVLSPMTAFAFCLLATMSITGAAALLIYRWRIVTNSLRFLWVVGIILGSTFWIFSLALSLFNRLIQSSRQPFRLGVLTLISFGVLLFLLVIYALQRRGSGNNVPLLRRISGNTWSRFRRRRPQ
jgi:hypothetical protein